MSRFLVLLFFLGLSQQLQAQQNVQFVDPQNNPIEGVVIISYLGKEYGPSDASGYIRNLAPEVGSMVQVFKEGYYIKVLELDWQTPPSEDIILRLQPNDISLEEITVSAKRIPFTDTLRVLDFDFQDTMLLVLGYDYLVVSGPDLKAYWTLENRQEFERLERDVRGNLFLLSEDSANQVLLRSNYIYFYPAVSIDQYQTYIEPLAAEMGTALVLRNNRPEQMPLPISPMRPGNQGKSMSFPPYHNQGVEFYIYRQGEEPKPFYFSVDTASLLLAHDAFMDAFNIAASMERFYDQYGVWQHEKLFDMDQAQKIYRMYYAKPLPMPIFQQGPEYWLFDRFTDVIVVFDAQGHEKDRFPFNIDEDFHSPLIIQDYRTGKLYALKEKRGMIYLHPFAGRQILPGSKVSLFAKETKVWQGRVYYIDEYNFLKLQS
jgi:hypothetical protein